VKEYKFLKFLDIFKNIFVYFGIDYRVLRKILQLKLTMDARRVPTVIMNNKKTDEGKNSFMSSLVVYGFIGLFSAAFVLFPIPMFLKMNFSIGIIIFMVMTTMISDFSAVLLDVKEKNILLPRPIDYKTINVAKVIHIIIYLFSITAAIAGPTLVAGSIKYGVIFFFIFLVEIILICGFVIFFTSMLYSLILGFFDGEKLKDVINYFQIILSVFLVVFYQLIGRLFNITGNNLSIIPKWWHYLIPTTWFAAPFRLFLEHDYSLYYILLSVIAVILPFITLVLYMKTVVPYLEKNLQKLNDSSKKRRSSFGLKERRQRGIATLLCSDKRERLFYRFTQSMTSNERKLKLKLYPNLALSAVIPFVFMLNTLSGAKTLKEIYTTISGSSYYFGLYITAILLASSIMMLGRSEKYKGAWIYRVMPLETPVPILKGAFKGFFMKFIIPVYFFVSLLLVLIFGIRIIPDIILIFSNMFILVLFIYKLNKKELPFFKDFQYTQEGNNVSILLLSFLLAGLCGGIHYAATFVTFGVTANIAVSLLIAAILWRYSFKITWKDIIKNM
jgi:hypothetical protein